MSDDTKPQGTVQIALRISPDLRERVKVAAEANNRSVNSELTATLEEKYPREIAPLVGPGPLSIAEVNHAIGALTEALHRLQEEAVKAAELASRHPTDD